MKNEVDVAALRARVELLEEVVGEAYQLAGAVGAPVRVLDNLHAAIAGDPLPCPTFLPVQAEDCAEVAELLQLLKKGSVQRESRTGKGRAKKVTRRNTLAAVLGRSGGSARTQAKAVAARANGSKGGRRPKFEDGDRVRVTEDAPGDYRGRVGTVRRRGPGRAEYLVHFSTEPREGYLNSWWLNPA